MEVELSSAQERGHESGKEGSQPLPWQGEVEQTVVGS